MTGKLVDKAVKSPRRKFKGVWSNLTHDHYELAVEAIYGRITLRQCLFALGKPIANVATAVQFVYSTLRAGVVTGNISITFTPKKGDK